LDSNGEEILMPDSVRVRFAPSPTGDPHVGNIRSALFNWLFARKSKGVFILRIEDTDRERETEGSVDNIMQSLKWLGIDWDEGPGTEGEYGPYVQSERVTLYKAASKLLIESDHAYYCYCSSDRLNVLRESQRKQNRPTGYDGRCRNLSLEEKKQAENSNITPVIRFKVPLVDKTYVTDVIRGKVTWENRLIDDFIILKSDGYPTYHLASVVDDNHMKISHVLRADEWLPSTPKHILLYDAFGWDPPQFAHLPLILGTDRSKLSKRHGSVSLMQFKEDGYLPEAMLNFLVLLGWSLDDKTTKMELKTIIDSFSLDRIGVSPSVFDMDKLSWLNGVYIRELSADSLAEKASSLLEEKLSAEVNHPLDWAYVVKVCALVQDRARTIQEIPDLTRFFFEQDINYSPILIWSGMGDKEVKKIISDTDDLNQIPLPKDRQEVIAWLESVKETLSHTEDWTHDSLEQILRNLVQDLSTTNRRLFGALRVVITGRTAAPPLFSTIEIMGKKMVIDRLKNGIILLSTSSN
jgi:glutamyl-tRNA synthetase